MGLKMQDNELIVIYGHMIELHFFLLRIVRMYTFDPDSNKDWAKSAESNTWSGTKSAI